MADKKVEEITTTNTTHKGSFAEQAKAFWTKSGKMISIVFGVIVLGIAAYFGYQKFVVEPNEQQANEAIFAAESLFDKMAVSGFNKDSIAIALNGGALEGQKVTGLLTVASKYGSTPAGNRANYMVGASYLHEGNFDKAIDFLKKFDGNGASQVQMKAYEMLGHAFAEKKNVEEALSYYKKASTVNTKDEAFSADALFLAANYAEASGKKAEAIDLFKKMRDDYPTNSAVVNGEVDKYLAQLGVVE